MLDRADEIEQFFKENVTVHGDILDSSGSRVFSKLKKRFIDEYGSSNVTISRDIKKIKEKLYSKKPPMKKGILVEINYADYIELWIKYPTIDTDGKRKLHVVPVLYFPNKSIATIKETVELEDGTVGQKQIPGMSKEELLTYFDSTYTKNEVDKEFLIRSLIYEEYIKNGKNREDGNVRHLWYTNLKGVLVDKLGLSESNDNLGGRIDAGWRAVIHAGVVTYEGMNIKGDKESGRLSLNRNSPFYNIIIAVEKMDKFESFQWLAKIFHTTLVTGGGHPSRAVTFNFVRELKEMGYDLDVDFYLCTISDLDPAGYYIQDAFRNQLQLAIESYGGTGTVRIERIFTRKEQITDDILKNEAIPWVYNKSKKETDTIWKYFCEQTKTDEDPAGGIYLNDGRRALVEMDVFSTRIMEKEIANHLLQLIERIGDPSKAIIPDLMETYQELMQKASEEEYHKWYDRLIKPLKNTYIEDTEVWESEIRDDFWKESKKIKSDYAEKIDELKQEKRDRVPELYDEFDDKSTELSTLRDDEQKEIDKIKEKYRELKDPLKESISDLEDNIAEKYKDLDEQIDVENDNKNDELDEVFKKKEFRIDRLEEFREEKMLIFNPIEEQVKQDVSEQVKQYADVSFFELEKEQDIRNELCSLLYLNVISYCKKQSRI